MLQQRLPWRTRFCDGRSCRLQDSLDLGELRQTVKLGGVGAFVRLANDHRSLHLTKDILIVEQHVSVGQTAQPGLDPLGDPPINPHHIAVAPVLVLFQPSQSYVSDQNALAIQQKGAGGLTGFQGR